VYVTDTAEADEIIEEPDYIEDVVHGQHEQQEAAAGTLDPTTAAEQAAAEAEDVATPSSAVHQLEVDPHWLVCFGSLVHKLESNECGVDCREHRSSACV
jgi:hypothetical protein